MNKDRIIPKRNQLSELPKLPLERVQIDHTVLDLIAVDDAIPLGRVTFTYGIDMATGYPFGYCLSFGPPDYLTVLECLRQGILPKNTKEQFGTQNEWLAYGIPTSLLIDSSSQYTSNSLNDICHLFEISLERGKVKAPWPMATLNRFMKTTLTQFIHTLPGTTLNSIVQKGNYQQENQIFTPIDELEKFINIYLVDDYAERFNRKLGSTPAQQWRHLTEQQDFCPRLPDNLKDFGLLFFPSTRRRIQHFGIMFESLQYCSPELTYLRAKLEDTTVTIKYNPGDLSDIHVYDPFTQTYIIVPTADQAYTQNLSLWKHKSILKFIHQDQTLSSLNLSQVKQRIQEIVTEEQERRKKSKLRSEISPKVIKRKPVQEANLAKSGTLDVSESEPLK